MDGPVPVRKSTNEIKKETMQEFRVDFKKYFRNYVIHSTVIDWKSVPDVIVPKDRDMTWKDLCKTDMGFVIWDYLFKDDVDGSKLVLFQRRRGWVKDTCLKWLCHLKV